MLNYVQAHRWSTGTERRRARAAVVLLLCQSRMNRSKERATPGPDGATRSIPPCCPPLGTGSSPGRLHRTCPATDRTGASQLPAC
eukprot:4455815-Prymnesium_polylepis.1